MIEVIKSDLKSKKKDKLKTNGLYFKQAYEVTDQYTNHKTWKEYCDQAVEKMNTIEIYAIKCDTTIRQLNVQFRN